MEAVIQVSQLPCPYLGSHNNLCSLATEIIVETLTHVDWNDLLAVRKTCKYLMEISKIRSLWANLFLKYSRATSNAPNFLQLELPLTNYTSPKLEIIVLRHKSVEYAARKGMLREERATSNRHTQTGALHLLRGGRWLLNLLKNGSLLCHDLDSPVHDASPLTPPVFSPWLNFSQCAAMSVHEIDNTPTLSARVAIACTKNYAVYPPWVQEVHRIDIWHLRLVFDGPDGAGARFVTERLATFPLDKYFERVYQLSLRERQIAFVCKLESIFKGYVAIVDWLEANGPSTNYPRRYLLVSIGLDGHIYLLSDSRLLVFQHSYLFLQSYSNTPATTDTPDEQATRTVLWEHEDRDMVSPRRISGPFICSKSTRFVVLGSEKILGVIFNDSALDTPVVTLLTCLSRADALSVTPSYHCCICQCWMDHGPLESFSFGWPDEGKEAVSAPISIQQPFSPEPIFDSLAIDFGWHSDLITLIDEGSGRVVSIAPSIGRITVWEMVP